MTDTARQVPERYIANKDGISYEKRTFYSDRG
jgi:hypothetical protein